MTKQEFKELTGKGTVLLDGAMGTNLYRAGMPRGICAEGWILEHQEIVEKLQKEYIRAGSQIIYAPTFGANRKALSRHGLDGNLEDMNERLTAVSRRAADGKVFVAGDLSPTGMILESAGGDDTPDAVFEVYLEQVRALARAGVDLLVIETMISVEETSIALDAASAVCDLPVLCSLSLSPDGRALFGGTAEEAVETLQEQGACAVGINCGSGPDQALGAVRKMKALSRIPVIAKPNAGLPVMDGSGNAAYSMGPDEFALHMKALIEAGAGMVGGCCGTTPEYIRELKKTVDKMHGF